MRKPLLSILALLASVSIAHGQQSGSISVLPAASGANSTDLVAASQVTPQSFTGFTTRKLTLAQISALVSAGVTTVPNTWTALQTINNLTIPKNNAVPPLQLTAPDDTSATWDTTPLAALEIAAPPTAWTRNFLSSFHLTANGASVDKGRGFICSNIGASDCIYIQNDGVGSTGFASLLTQAATNATGGVIGTTLSSQTGLVVRQETAINPSAGSAALLELDANGSATEMLRLTSSIAAQNGLIARMTGANAAPFVILNPGSTNTFQINNNGGITSGVNGGSGGILLMNGSTSGSTTLSASATGTLNLGSVNATIDGSGNIILGAGSSGFRLSVAKPDSAANALIAGTTKGVRIGNNSSGTLIEGVDNTGVGSFQPLFLNGTLVQVLTNSQVAMSINSAQHVGFSAGVLPTNNACTGFALATGSTDVAGRVTFNSATSCAINFGTAYANAPFCTVTPGTSATPSTVDATTTTGVLTANFTTAQTSMSWTCFGA